MTPHDGQAGLTENDAYPLLRYQSATEANKKGWLDYIKRFHPELYKQLKEESEHGQPSN